MEVHRHLGPGLLESAYEQCLARGRTAVVLQRNRSERGHEALCALISFVLFASFVVRQKMPHVNDGLAMENIPCALRFEPETTVSRADCKTRFTDRQASWMARGWVPLSWRR